MAAVLRRGEVSTRSKRRASQPSDLEPQPTRKKPLGFFRDSALNEAPASFTDPKTEWPTKGVEDGIMNGLFADVEHEARAFISHVLLSYLAYFQIQHG